MTTPTPDPDRARGELSMGDALTAAALLGADDDTSRAAIIELLGLDLVPPREAERPRRRRRRTPAREPVAEPGAATDPASGERADAGGKPVGAKVTRLEDDRASPPAWMFEGDDVAPPEAGWFGVPPVPPIQPAQARAAMAAAASSQRTGTRLDLKRLIQTASQLRSLVPPPLLAEMRIAPVVMLLVDEGESMEPYFDDVAFLATHLTDVAGRDRVERHSFVRTPLDVLDDDEDVAWKGVAGSLVVVISDLGVGGPLGSRDRGSPRRWRAFADAVARDGAALRVLTPFGPGRVPSGLDTVADIVGWDTLANLASFRA